MPIELVALTDFGLPFSGHLLDSLAAVFPVIRRAGSPGVWFVEVEQQSGGPDRARDVVRKTLDDLDPQWDSRVALCADDQAPEGMPSGP